MLTCMLVRCHMRPQYRSLQRLEPRFAPVILKVFNADFSSL